MRKLALVVNALWPLAALAAVSALALGATASALAQEPAATSEHAVGVCADLEHNAFAAEECAQTGEEADDGLPSFSAPVKDDGLPAWCRMHVEVVLWAGSDWQQLAGALADNPSPCADYYISVPPVAADATRLRAALIFRRLRELGPRFHPLAEVRLGGTGWAKWVADGNGTWYEAGVEFRRRMVAAGLQSELGETWLVNEFDRTTRLDTTERLPVEIARGTTRPYPRQAMRDLVRGLYEGAPGMPALPGAAEIGINFSHQNLPDVPEYKEQTKAWLEDSAFWADMQGRVRWLLREVYADTRFHGVPGTSREERRRHLEDYQEHLLDLVEAGPESVDTARIFLRETYLPLANAGYVALGGDHPLNNFVSGHGNTEVGVAQMMNFVSEQVYAIRHYAASHPQGAPAGRLGFSWDPINRFGFPAPEFTRQRDMLAERIALAIRHAYRQGGASAVGACTPPGSEEDWCQASRDGAQFTEEWENFRYWD